MVSSSGDRARRVARGNDSRRQETPLTGPNSKTHGRHQGGVRQHWPPDAGAASVSTLRTGTTLFRQCQMLVRVGDCGRKRRPRGGRIRRPRRRESRRQSAPVGNPIVFQHLDRVSHYIGVGPGTEATYTAFPTFGSATANPSDPT